MKKILAGFVLFLVLCGVGFAVPSKIMLQGRLVDEYGAPIANRAITSAKLYVGTAQTGGDIGLNVQTSSDGFFSKVVTLDSISLGKLKASQITGFKVKVGTTDYPSGDPFSVTSVPYALSADYVGGMTTQELFFKHNK